MSFAYGPRPDWKHIISLFPAAVERGVTFFDTADADGPFTNEKLVGEALAQFCGQVVMATKFAMKLGSNGMGNGLEHIRGGAEASLKRLKVDVIDLPYRHRVIRACQSRMSQGQ